MVINVTFENTVALVNSVSLEEFLLKQSQRNMHEFASFVETSRRNFYDEVENILGINNIILHQLN